MTTPRSIIGITYQGEHLVLPVADSSLPRIPERYGVTPDWVEPIPPALDGRIDLLGIFVRQCREKHYGEVAA